MVRSLKINKSLTFLLCAVGFIISCVEPFDLKVKTYSNILIVDGSIDDADRDQFITVKSFIQSLSGNISYQAETNAKVTIIEDEKNKIDCFEKPNGIYYLPIGFKTKVGSIYQLRISLKNGNEYISTKERMKTTPEIVSSLVKFDPKGIVSGDKKTPAHLIYISTKDLNTPGDYYVWRWKLYEKQQYCITCFGGIYITSPPPLGKCQTVASLVQQNIEYDYNCNSDCWEIKYSDDINAMSDIYSNGNEISNRMVAKVPFYERSGFLIEITQQNVSPAAFNYLKILGSQAQNNGTLVDSPPAPLIGNISNINDSKESVGGFFMVGNSKTKKIWVDRKDVGDSQPIRLLGRNAVSEPASTSDRPPFAPCLKSNTRTPLKPEAWPL